jgi:hypothetical protein
MSAIKACTKYRRPWASNGATLCEACNQPLDQHTDDRMAMQLNEFIAVSELGRQSRRLDLTPIVDDDYPQVRHEYESALLDLIAALRLNGRLT